MILLLVIGAWPRAEAEETNTLFLPVDRQPFGDRKSNENYNAEERAAAIQAIMAVGPETNGFRLALSVTNTAFVFGETVHLTVSLQNVSTNASSIWVSQDDYSFKVVGPDGKTCPVTELGNAILHPRGFSNPHGEVLSPGQTLAICIPLNSVFAMTNAGLYTVTASRAVPGKIDQGGCVWVPSAALKISINQTR
jgi:hypothetical protein